MRRAGRVRARSVPAFAEWETAALGPLSTRRPPPGHTRTGTSRGSPAVSLEGGPASRCGARGLSPGFISDLAEGRDRGPAQSAVSQRVRARGRLPGSKKLDAEDVPPVPALELALLSFPVRLHVDLGQGGHDGPRRVGRTWRGPGLGSLTLRLHSRVGTSGRLSSRSRRVDAFVDVAPRSHLS